METSKWSHKIYSVTTSHCRFFPVQHFFKYPLFYFGIDLDNISSLTQSNDDGLSALVFNFLQRILYSYNRFSLFSLRDEDYLFGPLLQKGKLSIKEALGLYLESELGFCPDFDRIELVTTPKVLGYSFNPVSFYFCYTKDKPTNEIILMYLLYEVHNTFGERHIYILQPEGENRNRAINLERKFHVSPFNDRSGTYSTTFLDPNACGTLDVSITIMENQKRKLRATVKGRSQPATPTNLISCFFIYPINALLTIPRILYQAYILHYIKKLQVYQRPAPHKPFLLNLPASLFERRCFELFKNFLKSVETFSGFEIILEEPSFVFKRRSDVKEGSTFKPRIILSLHSYELCSMLTCQLQGDNFLPIWAITYMTGEWSCPQLSLLLECLLRFQYAKLPSLTYSENLFFYAVKTIKTVFLKSRWKENAELSRKFLDQFILQATVGGRMVNKAQYKNYIFPDSLRQRSIKNSETKYYILVLPLHNNYSRFLSFDSPFDILAYKLSLRKDGRFSRFLNLIFYLILLCWSLLCKVLELFVFKAIADFHYKGDPNRVIERFYINLAFILSCSKGASVNDCFSSPIFNFCFQFNANMFKIPGNLFGKFTFTVLM